jgi:twitching motility protein PilT
VGAGYEFVIRARAAGVARRSGLPAPPSNPKFPSMADPNTEHLLGRIAVHLKMITMDQLAEATRLQGEDSAAPIGQVLIDNGWITPEQLQKLIQCQKEYVARRQAASSAPPASGAPATAPAGEAAPAVPAAASTPAAVPAPPARPRAAHPAPAATSAAKAGRAPGAKGAAAAAAGKAAARPVAAPPARGRAAGGSATNPVPAAARLEALLTRAVRAQASDLHIHSGAPVRLRLNGELVAEEGPPLPHAEAEALLAAAMTAPQRAAFESNGEIDFACTIAGLGRFRVNVYRQHRGIDGVFRVIPPQAPTLQALGLPASLARVVNFHQGLVLLTGPAGCGKSSTLAALVDILNTERRDHILTIEDPIEHVQPSKRCVVNQRQVNHHTDSFARALRAALREDPDIIVIGELRDRETISLALTAAETGHLVLGTLHTGSAIRTINRLLGVFPPEQQTQIRTMISESLKAIVSQRLVRTSDGKRRVPAIELLMVNRAVGNLIRENKTFQILSILQTGAPHGMFLMETSLGALVKAGTITKDEALRHCEDPKRLAA